MKSRTGAACVLIFTMGRTSRWALIAAAAAGGAVACSSPGDAPKRADAGPSPPVNACLDAGPGASTDGGFFPCDVNAILVAKCQRCHTSGAALDQCTKNKTCDPGPFPLLVWSDTRRNIGGGDRPVDDFVKVISTGFMPYQSPVVTTPVEKLTEAEKATMLQWARACAPPGTSACGDGAP